MQDDTQICQYMYYVGSLSSFRYLVLGILGINVKLSTQNDDVFYYLYRGQEDPTRGMLVDTSSCWTLLESGPLEVRDYHEGS